MLELNKNPKVNNPCPICGNMGQKVKEITVEYQVKNNIKPYGEQFCSPVVQSVIAKGLSMRNKIS